MTVVTVGVGALLSFVAFAVWRGRQVAIALAAAECPDCRVPLVKLHPLESRPSALATGYNPGAGYDPHLTQGLHGSAGPTWEVHACPTCDRVVTTVGDLPSPMAECPNCRRRSLVVYAERVDDEVFVDEWCDQCARRDRTLLGRPPRTARPPREPDLSAIGPAPGRAKANEATSAKDPRADNVLPFRKG